MILRARMEMEAEQSKSKDPGAIPTYRARSAKIGARNGIILPR
jgi:hypothetical protein